MKAPGTILPTADSLATNDRYAARLAQQKKEVAAAAGLLSPYVVGLETRYPLASPSEYAIVGTSLRVLYFKTTPKGDFSIAKPSV